MPPVAARPNARALVSGKELRPRGRLAADCASPIIEGPHETVLKYERRMVTGECLIASRT